MSGALHVRRIVPFVLAAALTLLFPALFIVAQEPTPTPAAPEITVTPLPWVTESAMTGARLASTPTPASPFELLFTDSFDDENYTANFWTFGAGWEQASIGGQGQVLQASGSDAPVTFVHDTLLDAAIQARFLVSAGAVRFNLRQSTAGAYTVTLTADGIVMLTRGADLLGMAASPVASNTWHTVRLSAVGGIVEVVVDDASVITAEDAAPLPAGIVSFVGQGLDDDTLWVDDFSLWIPAEQKIEPTRTEIAPIDGNQWTLLLSDDFDSGFHPTWMVDDTQATLLLVEHDDGQAVRFARYAPALFSSIGGLDDLTIQFDLRIQAGCARLVLGQNDSGDRLISFCDRGQLEFYNNSMLRGVAEIPLTSGERWYTIRITKTGSNFAIDVDDVTVSSVNDRGAQSSGTFSFLADGTDEENVNFIDNFLLWVPATEVMAEIPAVSSIESMSLMSMTSEELTSATGYILYPQQVIHDCGSTYPTGGICLNGSSQIVPNSGGTGYPWSFSHSDPDWSPTGESFVVIVRESWYFDWQEYLRIYTRNESTGLFESSSVIYPDVTDDLYIDIFDVAWSPDGSKIAFSALADEWGSGSFSPAIYYVDTSCSGACTATSVTADGLSTGDVSPSWSPDSQHIAFWSSRSNQAIYTVDYTGANMQAVGPVFGVDETVSDPSWSPDGGEIAFAHSQGPSPYTYGVRVLNLASSLTRQVSYPASDKRDWYPEWSPDGAAILFARGFATGTPYYSLVSVEANDDSQETGAYTQFSGSRASWWDPAGGIEADVALSMVVDEERPSVNDDVVFTLTVTNHGPYTASTVVIQDLLPPGLTYSYHWGGFGQYEPVSGLWRINSIAVDGTATLSLRATVTAQGAFTNTAELVSLYRVDPDLSNNIANAYVEAYDLALQFSDDFEVFDDTVWTLPPYWNYVDTIDRPNMGLFLVEDESPLPYGSATYEDVAVQARLWVEAGSGIISARYDDTEGLAYNLALDADGNVSLYRGSTLIDSAAVENITYGPPWHTARLIAVDDEVTVVVDDMVLITWTDPDPLPAGTVQFTALMGGQWPNMTVGVFVDDFELWLPEGLVFLGPITPTPLTVPDSTEPAAPHGLLRPVQPELGATTAQMTILDTPMVFQKDREDGSTDIYILDAGSSTARFLTDDETYDSHPALSPDGSTVAFSSWENGCSNIYLMNVQTLERHILEPENVDVECYNDQPAWSPDGTQIVFVTRAKGTRSAFIVVGADGSGGTILLDDAYNDQAPVWSPDGTKLALVSYRAEFVPGVGGFPGTFIMDADDMYSTTLQQVGDVLDIDPDWSPDGTKLVVSNRNLRGGVLKVIDVRTGAGTELENRVYGQHPVWAKGKILYQFDTGVDSIFDVFLVDILGSNNVQVHSHGYNAKTLRQSSGGVVIETVILDPGDSSGPEERYDDPNDGQYDGTNDIVTAVLPGEEVIVRVHVENTENDQLVSSAQISNLLPAGMEYLEYVSDIGTYDEISGIWTIPDFPENQEANMDIIVRVSPSLDGRPHDGVLPEPISNESLLISYEPSSVPQIQNRAEAQIVPVVCEGWIAVSQVNTRLSPSYYASFSGDYLRENSDGDPSEVPVVEFVQTIDPYPTNKADREHYFYGWFRLTDRREGATIAPRYIVATSVNGCEWVTFPYQFDTSVTISSDLDDPLPAPPSGVSDGNIPCTSIPDDMARQECAAQVYVAFYNQFKERHDEQAPTVRDLIGIFLAGELYPDRRITAAPADLLAATASNLYYAWCVNSSVRDECNGYDVIGLLQTSDAWIQSGSMNGINQEELDIFFERLDSADVENNLPPVGGTLTSYVSWLGKTPIAWGNYYFGTDGYNQFRDGVDDTLLYCERNQGRNLDGEPYEYLFVITNTISNPKTNYEGVGKPDWAASGSNPLVLLPCNQ